MISRNHNIKKNDFELKTKSNRLKLVPVTVNGKSNQIINSLKHSCSHLEVNITRYYTQELSTRTKSSKYSRTTVYPRLTKVKCASKGSRNYRMSLYMGALIEVTNVNIKYINNKIV